MHFIKNRSLTYCIIERSTEGRLWIGFPPGYTKIWIDDSPALSRVTAFNCLSCSGLFSGHRLWMSQQQRRESSNFYSEWSKTFQTFPSLDLSIIYITICECPDVCPNMSFRTLCFRISAKKLILPWSKYNFKYILRKHLIVRMF